MIRPETYRPAPIPTEGVTLPPELDALLERLAEHVHDLWAIKRIAAGWSWGPSRSDTSLEHPDLVPYGELVPDEQEFDRTTARETLRAIVALGYSIVPPGDPSSNG